MIRLLNLFQRVGLLRPTPAPQPESPRQDDVERVSQLIVERLSEDETLRGTLTDSGFTPVMGFISALVPPAVERALDESPVDAAEDTVSHAARMLARAVAAAAESGDTTGAVQALTPAILPGNALVRARSALPASLPAGATDDERARILVGTLREAIEGSD